MAHGNFHNVQAVLDFLPTNLDGLNILDLGCGCGQVIYTIFSYSGHEWVKFSGYPKRVIGLEIDEKCINFLHQFMFYIYGNVLTYDMLDFPYPKPIIKNTNFIISTEAFEHLTDKNRAIELLKYLYNLDCDIIITVPNGNNIFHSSKKTHFNHNTSWNRKDFERIGYKTKLVGAYNRKAFIPSKILLKIIDLFTNQKHIYESIVATKRR